LVVRSASCDTHERWVCAVKGFDGFERQRASPDAEACADGRVEVYEDSFTQKLVDLVLAHTVASGQAQQGPREGDVTTAGESITEYADARTFRDRGDLGAWQRTLDQIAEYNRIDCLSTLGLRDWLLDSAAAAGVVVGRDHVLDAPASPAIDDDDLLTRLRDVAGVDGRTPDQQVVAMVAAAVNYRAREAKPFWWAHFDRLSPIPRPGPTNGRRSSRSAPRSSATGPRRRGSSGTSGGRCACSVGSPQAVTSGRAAGCSGSTNPTCPRSRGRG
jgi:hypothetical protein